MNLAAVIVETRDFYNLEDIIVNRHLKFLPKYTKLYVFCSLKNIDRFRGLSCEIYYLEVIDDADFSIVSYNKMLTSADFWSKIEEENILIFQTDSGLLREGIEKFYDYDYVGACWKNQDYGGNGGLSLRHKSAMIDICRSKNYISSNHNEDGFFSDNLYGNPKYNLAPRDICMEFSTERVHALGTLGYHKIQGYVNQDLVDSIMNQYNKGV